MFVRRYLDAEDLVDALRGGRAARSRATEHRLGLSVSIPGDARRAVDLGQGRCKLWLTSEIERWRSERLAESVR